MLNSETYSINTRGKLGYKAVDVACNGLEAVNLWKESRYDLILMDCHMPEMDGYQATRKIRELEAEQVKSPTPIVAMTASAMTGDRELCISAGMTDYTTKPIDRLALAAMLQKVLAKAESLSSS